MNNSLRKRLNNLTIGEIILIVFIVLSVLGIIANELEKGYIFGKNSNGKKWSHYIRISVLLIALLIYIYYLKTRVEKCINCKSFLNNLDILASILFILGGIIFLYTEYKGVEESILIE